MDSLWSALSRRVEAKLGRPLPDPPPDDVADPEFLTLLSQLRQADPDLAEEVINVYTGTSERLPSEAEAAAERSRQRVRRHLFARFFRPDGLRSGRVRLSLRKTLNWIAAAVVISIMVWSLIPKAARVSTSPPRVASTTSQTLTRPTPLPPTPATRPSPAPSPALSPEPPVAPPTRVPPPPVLTVDPLGFPPPALDGYPATPYGTPPPSPSAAPTMTRDQVVVFEASRSQRADVSPVVYEQKEAQAGVREPQIIVVAPQGEAATRETPGPVIVYDASAAQPQAGNPAPVLPAVPDSSAQAAAPTISRGQLLEVRLVTPVAVASTGGATPALAEIAQGPAQGALLIGQATRSPDGLVLIQFSALIPKDGREQPFRGTAYDNRVGRFGVPGQVSTMMPGAASALLAATLQSVSDYFKARAQQQQVTITNGFLTITQGTPSLWDGLASAIARAFAPGTQSTSGPTVVTRLERGQSITILVI